MASDLRISGLVEESIVDGPGLRFVVFTQGCPHHCPGCHNPQTHDFDGGFMISVDKILAMFDEDPLLSGMTFSGGEPFCQPGPLCELAAAVKARGKHVLIYSGYTFEQLQEMAAQQPEVERLLKLCDTLVDGPFIEELKDLDLLFRGSSNQRIIELKEFK